MGLTQAMVAAMLHMSRPTVSQIEAGKRPVNSLELKRFARLYRVSVGNLLDDPDDTTLGDDSTYFPNVEESWYERKGFSGVRAALDDFVQHCERYARLERVLGHPTRDLMVHYNPEDLGDDPVSQGEAAAAHERNRLGLGHLPVANLPEVLEHQHVKVVADYRPDAAHLSGATLYRKHIGPAIFVNVAGASYSRGRLNVMAAHAYAHLLFDRDGDHVDYSNFVHDARPFERRANAFAAAFLMPRETIWAELNSLGWRAKDGIGHAEAMCLALRLGVTHKAVLWRLADLGLIHSKQKHSLDEQPTPEVCTELGLDASVPEALGHWTCFRQGGRFRMLVFQAYQRGHISAADGADLLGIEIEAFERHMHRGRTTLPPASINIS